MAQARAIIDRSINNGPWIVVFDVDGEVQNVLTGIANLSAAVDQAKALIAAGPLTLGRTTIITKLT